MNLADIAAYRGALAAAGATEFRRAATTEDAIALSRELPDAALDHAERVRAAVAVWDALTAETAPTDRAALTAHLNALARAEADFWDGFEGQSVDGVQIIRRR